MSKIQTIRIPEGKQWQEPRWIRKRWVKDSLAFRVRFRVMHRVYESAVSTGTVPVHGHCKLTGLIPVLSAVDVAPRMRAAWEKEMRFSLNHAEAAKKALGQFASTTHTDSARLIAKWGERVYGFADHATRGVSLKTYLYHTHDCIGEGDSSLSHSRLHNGGNAASPNPAGGKPHTPTPVTNSGGTDGKTCARTAKGAVFGNAHEIQGHGVEIAWVPQSQYDPEWTDWVTVFIAPDGGFVDFYAGDTIAIAPLPASPLGYFVAAAHALHEIEQASVHAIDVGEPKLDWAKLIAREKEMIGFIPDAMLGLADRIMAGSVRSETKTRF